MKRIATALFSVLALVALVAPGPGRAAEPQVRYPTGYRAWQHVKSMVLEKGHPLYDAVGGMHHIYANPKALQGYKTRAFPDGSVIVFDLFEAVAQDNAISEGRRKAVVVMERSGKRFQATDGWGYQVFDPATRKGTLDAKGAAGCATCHFTRKAEGFVFSERRD